MDYLKKKNQEQLFTFRSWEFRALSTLNFFAVLASGLRGGWRGAGRGGVKTISIRGLGGGGPLPHQAAVAGMKYPPVVVT